MKLASLLVSFLFLTACLSSSDDGGGGKGGKGGANGAKGNPYSKVKQEKFSGKVGQEFYCLNNADQNHPGFNVSLKKDGSIKVDTAKNDQNFTGSYEGTYDIKDSVLSFEVANGQIQDKSQTSESALGLLLTFESQYLKCHATGHDIGEKVEGEFKCPTIKFIPSVGYEDNKFTFYKNGMVLRNRTKELSGVDTLYRSTYGIYLIDGDYFGLFFGDLPSDDKERFLSGKIQGDGFTIDQLEPDKGICK